ncbi:MAG: SsrA-binding protein SmpB [SAR324 cluster bacterium]|nr:SsrA-binding protein SmpB [SAR324 cluster bacterium]
MEKGAMNIKIIVTNRKAHFEYEIVQTFETGIELRGTEVKSLRLGKANISESYCAVSPAMEVFLINAHINHYDFGNRNNHDPLQARKLLLRKQEIRKLYGQSREKGLTLIPLKMYFKHGLVKVEIALVKGKKLHDKRESLKKDEAKIEIARNMKNGF